MAKPHTNHVALPAVVDLDTLDSVRDQLLDAVEAGTTRVDGAKVERVATNALLMLISAARTAGRHGFKFEVAQPSAPMVAAIERLGLAPTFAGLMKK